MKHCFIGNSFLCIVDPFLIELLLKVPAIGSHHGVSLLVKIPWVYSSPVSFAYMRVPPSCSGKVLQFLMSVPLGLRKDDRDFDLQALKDQFKPV